MKQRYFFILFIIFIFSNLVNSQLKEILVLNEGAFDYTNNKILIPVTVGSYDPSSNVYKQLNIIDQSRFASDIILDQQTYWVAADQRIVRFDLKSHQVLSTMDLVGVRKLAIYNDYLIVTRGEYLKKLDSYIQVYNKSNLSLVFQVPFSELPFTTESIIVKGDIAYIAINNGFDFGNEVGKILKLNLKDLKVETLFELGDEGKNPENLMLRDNLVISLNNKSFTGSSISLLNLDNSNIETFNLTNVSSLCGTSVLVGESVVYQQIDKTEIGNFQLATKQSGFLNDLGHSYYGMHYDSKFKLLCAGETDFKTAGKVYVYDDNFNLKFEFSTGVTPGYFLFVDAALLSSKTIEPLHFDISPNPIVNKLRVICQEPVLEVQVLDFCGRSLIQNNQRAIALESLQAGVYMLSVRTKDQIGYKRFIKSSN